MEEISKINKRYASFLRYLLFIYLAWFIATVLLDNLLMRSWLQKSVDKKTRLIINAIRILIISMGIQSAIFIYNFIFWVRNRKNYKLSLNFYVLWLLMFLSALFGGLFWGIGGGIALAAPFYAAPLKLNIYVWFSLGIIGWLFLVSGIVFIIKIAIHKISIISVPAEFGEHHT